MPTDAIATAAFKGNPTGFLAGNMILAPIGNAKKHNHSEHLGLTPAYGVTGVRQATGAAIPVWQITRADKEAGDAYFRSYIADYAQGETTRTTLGSNEHAEFCFTANMNGCTFGLGMQAGDGTLIVTHGNAANTRDIKNFDSSLMGPTGSTALQTSLQYTRAKGVHGVGGQVFEPEHYRNGNRQSVTFGHRARGTGSWTWYFVSYTRLYGVITSYGVQPMTTNTITA